MKRNSKHFLALFMAVAMSVTPVSYAYAEDSAVAGVENTESGQQTVEVADGKNGAADAAGQPAEEVTGQEEETTAGQGTDENQKSQEEPKVEENAETGNVTEAEKKEAGEDGKSDGSHYVDWMYRMRKQKKSCTDNHQRLLRSDKRIL